MKKVYTDRSRIELAQRCKRARWYEYHESGTGIVTAKRPLPLAVGGSVHEGLAELLRGQNEDAAVEAALTDFAAVAGRLDIATGGEDPAADAADGYQAWLYEEQSALVEALVRAWARRRLRLLLERYEVLEVEREGEWLLSRWLDGQPFELRDGDERADWELWFMSRPDALLRDRQDSSLSLLSFKTAASWDVRKERDALRDSQGLSEAVEVEKRLGTWWADLHGQDHAEPSIECPPGNERTVAFLRSCPAPPRILSIRYEYLLKGERWQDKDLAERFAGMSVRVQKSHLVRAYRQQGMTADDRSSWCWSWEYLKSDGSGETSKLYWKSWRAAPVWESMTIREWIDRLDAATMTMSGEDVVEGLAPRELGYVCEGGQAQGYTAQHPLDVVFPPAMLIMRNDDESRDWIEMTEAQEVEIAQNVEKVRQATDDGEKRHLLNIYFPMTRRACEYPTTCPYVPICYGGDDIRKSPLDSGRYEHRIPNHPVEGSDHAQANVQGVHSEILGPSEKDG